MRQTAPETNTLPTIPATGSANTSVQESVHLYDLLRQAMAGFLPPTPDLMTMIDRLETR